MARAGIAVHVGGVSKKGLPRLKVRIQSQKKRVRYLKYGTHTPPLLRTLFGPKGCAQFVFHE
jgi:hypothetical protein